MAAELPCCVKNDICSSDLRPHDAVPDELPLAARRAARLVDALSHLTDDLMDDLGFDSAAEVHEWPSGTRLQFLRN